MMRDLLALGVLFLIFLGIVGVTIYETVYANQLFLPTAPLTIPMLLLPVIALVNATFATRTALQLRGQTRGSKSYVPAIPLRVIVTQVIQAIFAVVLATLLAVSATPSAAASCLIETQWQRMYSGHEADAIRRIQDTLGCCGFNSPRDRAWPFPVGRNGKQSTCEDTWRRHSSCHAPWASAMRTSAGVELGVLVVVEILQLISLLILSGNSYFRRTGWAEELFGAQSSRRQSQPTRPLLAAHDEYPEDADADDEHEGEVPEARNGGNRRGPYGTVNGPRLEPSYLGSGVGRNEWADHD